MSEEEVKYDAVAYDITYDSKKKVYNLVTVEYNTVTKLGKVASKVPIGDSRLVAVSGAKKAIVDRVLAIDIDKKSK